MSTSQGFGYWVRWQVPVCALIFIVPAVIALNFIRKGNAEPLKSCVLWKPCWRNLNPLWLLFYRAFACLCLAWTLYSMVSSHGAFVLYYFYTQWTLALVMCYFALGTVISAYGCCGSSSSITNRDKEFKGKSKRLGPLAQKEILAGPWGYLMHAMYQTSGAASILTDIVFWCVLVPLLVNVQFELTLLIGALHSLNALLLIGDTALNGLTFTWVGFAYFVLWSCLYISFQWIIHAFGSSTGSSSRWPYPFLELDTPWAPLCYFGLALFHVPCYWIYALIVKGKDSILSRLFPHAFVKV
ncbi:uncharacterized protein LOC107426215 isoform X1 [Ziziphus jujuba]|uniref:Uncharacterized protein LOC107426215 isoform X1 n=1 Tax=Ziziphus jujuba TaxID=326968 RepID=A0A6P4ART3_ZIZJJ|nr:uncharacterized protein LOC107426215 isoform X1 [Ziziphus jujuba]